MANSLTQGTSQAILDHYFGGTTVGSPPATLYVGLSTTTIADDGTNITEPVGNGYAGVSVTNNATNWPAASAADPSHKKNGTVITFPTATGSWGTITDVFIKATNSSGAVLVYGALSVAKTVSNGDVFDFPVNDLDITLT